MPQSAGGTDIQIKVRDISRLSPLNDAGVEGGIHGDNTYLMSVRDGSVWIFKTTHSEERDEIFAYELAKLFFNGVVPETQIVCIPRIGCGSAMRKVSGIAAGRVDGLHGYFHSGPEILQDLASMCILDYVIGNTDRHPGNWFLQNNGRIAAIDNGFAGRDMTMSLQEILQPADVAEIQQDEELWPKLLLEMAKIVKQASVGAEAVRSLAERVGLKSEQAIATVKLWEPKMDKLTEYIRSELDKVLPEKLAKAKVYINDPSEAPEGVHVEKGPRGGIYYESEPNMAGMGRAPEYENVRAIPMSSNAIDEGTEQEIKFRDILDSPEYVTGPGMAYEKAGAMKDMIVKQLATRTGLDYNTVNDFVATWAGSSSDSTIKSLALQMAASELFGIEVNPFIKDAWGSLGTHRVGGEVQDDRTKYLKTARIIAQGIYDTTQEFFRKQGIDKLTLFRGMKWNESTDEDGPTPEEVTKIAREGEEVGPNYSNFRAADIEFHLNPLSSWAYTPTIAETFANRGSEDDEEEGDPDYDDPDFREAAEQNARDAYENWLESSDQHDEGSEEDDQNMDRDDWNEENPDATDEEKEEWQDNYENPREYINYADWEENFLKNAGNNDIYSWYDENVEHAPLQPVEHSVTRMMAVAEIPVQKIFSTALTGLGCLDETEIVVLGAKDFPSRAYVAENEELEFNTIANYEDDKDPKMVEKKAQAEKRLQWCTDNLQDLMEGKTASVNAAMKEVHDKYIPQNDKIRKRIGVLANWWATHGVDKQGRVIVPNSVTQKFEKKELDLQEKLEHGRIAYQDALKMAEEDSEEPYLLQAQKRIEEAGFNIDDLPGWKPRGLAQYEPTRPAQVKAIVKWLMHKNDFNGLSYDDEKAIKVILDNIEAKQTLAEFMAEKGIAQPRHDDAPPPKPVAPKADPKGLLDKVMQAAVQYGVDAENPEELEHFIKYLKAQYGSLKDWWEKDNMGAYE